MIRNTHPNIPLPNELKIVRNHEKYKQLFNQHTIELLEQNDWKISNPQFYQKGKLLKADVGIFKVCVSVNDTN